MDMSYKDFMIIAQALSDRRLEAKKHHDVAPDDAKEYWAGVNAGVLQATVAICRIAIGINPLFAVEKFLSTAGYPIQKSEEIVL